MAGRYQKYAESRDSEVGWVGNIPSPAPGVLDPPEKGTTRVLSRTPPGSFHSQKE